MIWLLFLFQQDTELLLKKEANVTEDQVQAEPGSSTQTNVTQALAAYKRCGAYLN
jgi:hypothetical protein